VGPPRPTLRDSVSFLYYVTMDILLFGIQGSGKGTQARKLVEEFGYFFFETGAELRKIIASGTELGKEVASYTDKGNLAPTPIVMEVVRTAIAQLPTDQKILFDGIPRSIDQKEQFDPILADLHRDITGIQITLPEEEAVKRLVLRAEKEGRTDDVLEDAIRRRIEVFKEKTVPVIEAYRQEGKMVDIDGQGVVEEVYERVKSACSFLAS